MADEITWPSPTDKNYWPNKINNTIDGVLKYPSPLVTNNPESYGIVFADDIAGHRTVPTKEFLYIIPTAILSKSKTNEHNDAIGQLWYVREEGSHYKLIDWENRHNEEGWEEFTTGSKFNNQKILTIGNISIDNNKYFLDIDGKKLLTSEDQYFLENDDIAAIAELDENIKLFDFDIFSQEPHNFKVFFDKSFNIENSTSEDANQTNLIIKHNNVITEQFTPKLGKIGFDENGHIIKFVEITDTELSSIGNSGSDMRFKQSIKHINKGILDKLMQLDIISYIWCKKGEDKRDTFGVNATQLRQLGGLFTKIVHERLDEDKTLWVEYDRFGILAIKGIQEIERKRKEDKRKLLQTINKQQTRIEELERANQLLARRQTKVENQLKMLLQKFK